MFIGIDVGHTNLKAVAFDSEWNTIGKHGIEAGMVTTSEDRHEIPIGERWDLLLECLSELRSQTGDEPVEGIGLGGGGGGLYPLDENREPFMNGIPLLDERAMGIIQEWKSDGTYTAISEKTGIPVPPGAAILSLRWLKENEPERYERIEHILNLKDVMRYKLTGELALEISDATFSFTHHQTQDYDEEIFDLAGVPDAFDALPELKGSSHEIAGYTTQEVQEKTGISEGTPVVAGAHDACVNSLGVGAIDRDIVTTAGGTWSLSTKVLDEPSVELDTWCCENFLERGTWMLEIAQPTGTISSDWFVDEFFESEQQQADAEDMEVWDIIEEQIEDVETNAVFHPFLFGNPYGYMYQENASGSFTGLSATDGRLEMLRAVYEGIAFVHRWQIEQYDEAFGVDEIRFTGGAARSEFWSQLFADVLEMPITITDKEESGCFGAAMLAAIAVGEIDDLEETADYVEIAEEYRPNETDLGRKYETFRELTVLMEDAWDEHEALRTSTR
ncbi:FGGY-family carbohydrate kinase [Halohasta litorea]|uniref:FGGY-family carbohydrate kinase n=1 Tax=Halohasta litorea TaxID=869891 RepID=A0ABD6D9C5_9EURY|nr:FGGY family carbohydrate kinase [Halohasta litorea]